MTTYALRQQMLKLVRMFHLALGLWLVSSTFIWEHSDLQLGNAWLVGATAAVIAVAIPRLRWIIGVLALWLFVSAFALAHADAATVWNNVIVAVIMFSASIGETMGPPGRGYPPA